MNDCFGQFTAIHTPVYSTLKMAIVAAKVSSEELQEQKSVRDLEGLDVYIKPPMVEYEL